MAKLTLKQKKFCEIYVKTGNASESARQAGYSLKTAPAMGLENLEKPIIQDYIKQLTKPDEDKRIADATEIMQYLTSVMRGEMKDQFELEASLQDRTKAAVELAKRVIDVQAKTDNKETLDKLDEMLKAVKDGI